VKKLLLVLLIWGGCFLVIAKLAKMYQADVYYDNAMTYLQKREFEMAIVMVKKAMKSNPLEPNYYRGASRVYLVSGGYEDLNTQAEYKKVVLELLKKAYQLNSNNLVTIRNEIPMYFFLAYGDLRLPMSPENLDPVYLPLVKEFFNSTKKRFAHDAGVVALVGEYEKMLSLTEEYGESVKIIRELRPDLLEWYRPLVN
jgi:hypothetical protein